MLLTAEVAEAGASSMMSIICERAMVKKERLWDVVGNDKWTINNMLDEKYEPRLAGAIVKDAEALVGQELPYCLFSSNCEHFVTELRYGKPESRQVSRQTWSIRSKFIEVETGLRVLRVLFFSLPSSGPSQYQDENICLLKLLN